jgi:hypothetical protein
VVRPKFSIALLSMALTTAIFSIALSAQEQKPQEPQPAKPEQPKPVQSQRPKRSLWIAKFTSDTKAAAAVSTIQASDANALKYGNLFETVKTFDSDLTQPTGTWTLDGKELDFSGGSAATRALVGFGAGRAHITMEYTLSDPDGKVMWTQKITTKPSFWGSAGAMGAVQSQGQAMDEQGQKLTDALSKFFTSDKTRK